MTQTPQAKLYRRKQTGKAHSETAQKIVSESLHAVDNNCHRAAIEIVIIGVAIIIIISLFYQLFIIIIIRLIE